MFRGVHPHPSKASQRVRVNKDASSAVRCAHREYPRHHEFRLRAEPPAQAHPETVHRAARQWDAAPHRARRLDWEWFRAPRKWALQQGLKSAPRISVTPFDRIANIVPSEAAVRSEEKSFAVDTVKEPGMAADHDATGPPGALPNARYTASPLWSACISGAPVIEVTCGCGAGSKVGGNAVKFICPRQLLHALDVPPSPLSPTNTLCALVAATREGPEFKYPATPPTNTFEPLFAPPSGLIR